MAIDKKSEIRQASDWPTRRHDQRERKVLSTAMSYTPAVPENWPGLQGSPTSVDGALDRLAAGVVVKTVPVVWDLSIQGGALGLHDLGFSLPGGAVIQSITLSVLTPLASTAPTATLQLVDPTSSPLAPTPNLGPASLPTFTAISTTPYRASGLTALQALVSDTPLTAGKVVWWVTYFLP